MPSLSPIRGLLFLALLTPLQATDFYVSPTGRDTFSGTFSAPFASIQKAIKTAQRGDTVLLRGGTYREMIEFGHGAGEGRSGLTLRSYGAEQAIISAFNRVEPGRDGVGHWEHHAGEIWKIQLPESWTQSAGNNLVRVNGKIMQEARWPNASDLFNFDYREMAFSETGGITPGSHGRLNLAPPIPNYAGTTFCDGFYTDSNLSEFPAQHWVGAMIDLNPGGGVSATTGIVTASNGDRIQFRYLNNNNSDTSDSEPYFLWNTLSALDTEQEAFLDVDGISGPSHTLYLWSAEGNPALFHEIEVRARRDTIVVKIASDIRFEQLTSLGGDVDCRFNSAGLTFEQVQVLHGGAGLNRLQGRSAALTLRGSDHTLRDSFVGFTYGGGVQTGGSGDGPGSDVTIDNNVIQRCGEFGIGTWNSERLTVTRNTVAENGGFNIAIFAPASTFNHNHCYLAGLRTTDEASMNANGTNRDMLDTEIAFNWVHDNVARSNLAKQINGGKGIRLDSSSGSAFNIRIHHNIIWNIQGRKALTLWALAPADDGYQNSRIRAYHNTLSGEIKLQGNGTRSVLGHDIRNNIAERIEVGDLGDHSADDAIVTNNLFSRQGASEEEWPDNIFSQPLFRDGSNGDFSLGSDSPARDAGLPIPNISGPHFGANPDLGALEMDPTKTKYWSAGAIILPQDVPNLTLHVEVTSEGERELHIRNIPAGRVLPDNFATRIGEVTSHHLSYTYSIETHRATGIVRFPDQLPAEGIQPAAVSTDGGTNWIPLNWVPWIPIPPQPPIVSEPQGGATATLVINAILSTRKAIPVDILRSSDGDLTHKPVPLVIDTRPFIASGDMTPVANNLRFRDLAGTTELEYYLQSGLNSASTLFWLRNKPGESFNGRQIYLVFEDPASPPASNPAVLFSRYGVLQDQSLAVWYSANSMAGFVAQGAPLNRLADLSPFGHHALQSDSNLQPQFEEARSGGLATIAFEGTDFMLAGDLTPSFPESERVSYVVVHRNELGTDEEGRTISAGIGNSESMWAPAGSSSDLFVHSSRRRKGPNLRNFTLGKKANGDKKYFSGELAEILVWSRELQNSSPGEWELAKEYVSRKYNLANNVRAHLRLRDTVMPATVTLNDEPLSNFRFNQEGSLEFEIPPVAEGTKLPVTYSVEILAGNESFLFEDVLQYLAPVEPSDPVYPEWASKLPIGLRAPETDIEGDGLPNLLEYYFDLNPKHHDPAPLRLELADAAGANPLLHLFFRRNRIATDVNISVEASDDLRTWRTVPSESYELVVVNNDVDGDESAELIRLTLPVTLRSEAFRLRAELSIGSSGD